jgi:2-polyprenyl-3-methyl-5-hydroxy-6-metoxy-1,4-benzoquinol methylase
VSLVRSLNRSPILDVGAAQGMLGQALQGRDLILDGVEMNAAWAEMARPFYRRVLASSIEDAQFSENTYRVVVCGDVLEHCVDPAATLRLLCRAATPDATFIVSLPNVAHIAVRALLLAGQFPPMERGILDKTHLHFYTLDTARALLESAGLHVVRARPTGVPLDELWRDNEESVVFQGAARLQHAAIAAAPRLFGFQWVLMARRAR